DHLGSKNLFDSIPGNSDSAQRVALDCGWWGRRPPWTDDLLFHAAARRRAHCRGPTREAVSRSFGIGGARRLEPAAPGLKLASQNGQRGSRQLIGSICIHVQSGLDRRLIWIRVTLPAIRV